MKHKVFLAAVLLPVLMAGCNWVPLKPAGSSVHILGRNNLAGCEQMGWVGVATRAEFLFGLQRNPQTIKTELENLARNAAAERGANAIVAKTEIQNGKQDFDIYRCH